jgi:CBS domain-containing protein
LDVFTSDHHYTGDPLNDARRTMDAEKIRALPVLKDGKLVGSSPVVDC